MRIDSGVSGIQPNNAFTADLAQAQAQLQSLRPFCAAAGGHHHKLPFFNFPDMLPNMMAANMMGLGLGGVNLLQWHRQQFQSQPQQQSNQPQHKSLFTPYLPQGSLPPLLAAGKLLVGILCVNKRNCSDAYSAFQCSLSCSWISLALLCCLHFSRISPYWHDGNQPTPLIRGSDTTTTPCRCVGHTRNLDSHHHEEGCVCFLDYDLSNCSAYMELRLACLRFQAF
jgi:hypothetical protein